jgi:hypothetical protein
MVSTSFMNKRSTSRLIAWLRLHYAPVCVAALCAFVAALQWPLIQGRTSKENAAERQAQNAGMIRMFCRYDGYSPALSPNLPFGKRPFNVEFAFFEYLQGRVSRWIDGPECDSVEVVGRTFGVLSSIASIIAVFLLASVIAGPLAGALSALGLSSNFLWLKFSSFIMVENRMLLCALLAMLCMLRTRRPWARFMVGTTLWFLTITQKPQAFAFIGPFYLALECVLYRTGFSGERQFWTKRRVQAALSVALALLLAALSFSWSARVNARGDLPWLVWTGPTVMRWFFGGLEERFQWAFYKSLIFDTFKKTGLFYALISLGLFWLFSATARMKVRLGKVLLHICFFAATFALGRFMQTLVFLNVYKVHDYYALPGNLLGALIQGILMATVVAYIYGQPPGAKARPARGFALAVVIGVLVAQGTIGVHRFHAFSVALRTPGSPTYQNEFNL